MTAREKGRKVLRGIRYFFPFVLLFNHLKHNLIGVLYWVFFFAIVTDRLGRAYGIPYLFLSPEYQGDISFWSFALLGFAFGGLTMAFNSYSYVRMGSYFPFLATVHKPFVKFCMNNTLIPLLFLVVYLIRMVNFQRDEEFATTAEIWGYVSAYLFGFFLFVGISIAYFFPTNKNFFDLLLLRQKTPDVHRPAPARWRRLGQGKTMRYSADAKTPLYWYFGKSFRIQQCRSTRHYSSVLLQQVFAQNRISTTVFEVTTVTAFIVLGLFRGRSVFDVPAAMSIVLLLTIVLMLFSALISWLKNWTYIVIIGMVVVMNFFSVEKGLFQFENQAYGLDYSEKCKASYSQKSILESCTDTKAMKADSLSYIRLLNTWKKQTGEAKPLLIIINTSGGGSRSAAWMFEVFRHCDSLSGGNFTKHTALITGASGGMVGASYYRSLYLERAQGTNIDLNDDLYFERITDDLLNKLSFAASTNDIFFRYQSKLRIGRAYNYDRGMAFEDDLNENTNGVMNHALRYFKKPEQEGKIPVMIYSPTIVNDGRRLLISSQGLSFMTGTPTTIKGMTTAYENIDIHRLLKDNDPDHLRFTSVLRMSATFPFVLPMVTLPTTPSIQVMDAGTRDNFGVKTMVEWLYALRGWIRENTSGVMIVQVRDTKRLLTGEEIKQVTFFDKFTLPFSNVYGNFPRTQDFDQEELLKMSGFEHDFPVQFASMNLREYSTDRISLSWHLTSLEKLKIRKALNSTNNRLSVQRVLGQLH